MIEAEIQITAGGWRTLVDDPRALVMRAVEAVGAEEGTRLHGAERDPVRGEISIVLSDDAHVRGLNRLYRGRDKPTNVLAFPPPPAPAAACVPEAGACLGDVILACETVKREAEAQKKPFANHMCHLIIHGSLHLLGYDHGKGREAARMEAKETAILARLGIPDPYVAVLKEEARTAPDG